MKFTKILAISIIIIGIIISIFYFTFESNLIKDPKINQNDEKIEFVEWSSAELFKVLVNPDDFVSIEGKILPLKATFGLKEELEQRYNEIGFFNDEDKPIFIIPTFTASAYLKNGFYDFYNKSCNEQCLTTEIISEDKLDYNSSANAVKILQLLEYIQYQM